MSLEKIVQYSGTTESLANSLLLASTTMGVGCFTDSDNWYLNIPLGISIGSVFYDGLNRCLSGALDNFQAAKAKAEGLNQTASKKDLVAKWLFGRLWPSFGVVTTFLAGAHFARREYPEAVFDLKGTAIYLSLPVVATGFIEYQTHQYEKLFNQLRQTKG